MNGQYQYTPFSENSTVSLRQADPVQCCLTGKSGIFNAETCPENPLRRDIWLCPAFMSQRCASNWDGYCDIYLQEKIGEDATGKAARQFLSDTADSKFCRLDSNAPGSTCFTKCEMFNPTAPNSAQVCKTEGDIIYRDSQQLWNIDTNYNWSGKLSTASPIKITACKKTCDKFTPEKLSNDDRVINECLDTGSCADVMQNLAENIVSRGVKDQVQNKRLKQFIDAYIIQKTNTTPRASTLGKGPNLSTVPFAMPAADPYVPYNTTYTVADIGNKANTPQLNIASNLTKSQVAVEPFRYLQQQENSSKTSILTIALLVVFVLFMLWLFKGSTTSGLFFLPTF